MKENKYKRNDMSYEDDALDPAVEAQESEIVADDDEAIIEKKRKDEFVRKVLGDDKLSGQRLLTMSKPKKSKKETETAAKIAACTRYNAKFDEGLSLNQVEDRQKNGLVNVTDESNAKTYRSIFVGNICTFFNFLCIVVAVALLGWGGDRAWINCSFFLMMLVNTGMGIFQEIRAKRSIEKLSLISSPFATVVRNGEKSKVPIKEVVLDDVVFYESGKQIMADGIVLKGEMQVNESLLTGESDMVTKKAGDFLYGGSFVTSGTCYARVDKIGDANYVSSLTAFAKKYRKPNSEILSGLKLFITVIGILIIPITVLMCINNYSAPSADDILKLGEQKAVALAIETMVTKTAGSVTAMIPSGMFFLTSMTLSASVYTLARKQVLVQDLYCIEMLARVDMLCLDKTGTITDGTMRVQSVTPFKNETGYNLNEIVGSLLSATEDNNQTAIALKEHFGISKAIAPSVIMPFSSQRKISAVSFEDGNTYFLGAPEFIMKDMGPRLEKAIADKAKEGLRVLLLAVSQGEIKGDRLPTARRPLALIAIEDHVRDDAFETLKWFADNDVEIRVISGDNPVTVSEVARRAGIKNADRYVSLDGKTAPEVVELASQYSVFGRVTPEQKRILIRAFKAMGHTVAMTGDGVNDILALKEADCSVAIASGSDAARNVSHMVLLDNNFAKMPSVVFEGRRVVNNIQKSSSLYLMKTLFSIIVSILMILFQEEYPLEPSQLLLLEMLIIGIPSFFLAFQPNKNRIEGRFLANIIKKAFPAGLSLIISFMTLFILKRTPGVPISNDIFSTLTVMVVTFGGFMMLVRLCMPFDIFRGLLCLLCGSACLAIMIVLGDLLGINIKGMAVLDWFVVITIIEASYFLVSVLTLLMSKIKINSDPSEKVKEGKALGR